MTDDDIPAITGETPPPVYFNGSNHILPNTPQVEDIESSPKKPLSKITKVPDDDTKEDSNSKDDKDDEKENKLPPIGVFQLASQIASHNQSIKSLNLDFNYSFDIRPDLKDFFI